MEEKNSPKNIIVTGAAGFIGSHLCEELVKNNNVIGIDNYITGSESNIDQLFQLPNFEFIRHDVTQPIDLEEFREMKKFKVDVLGIQEIYHAACPTSPKQYDKFPIETLLANSYGTKNILDLAVKYKAKFLLFSSGSIYGEPRDEGKIKEDYWGFLNPIGPRSCYNEGKRFAESMVVNYREKYHLEAKIVRIFNTYGPRMRLDDGRLIPDFINQALENEPVVIYRDKEEITSLCYISDLINGLIRMMDSSELGPINLGSDQGVKIVEVAQKIIELTDSQSEIVFEAPPPYTAKQGLPDISLAKDRLGWFPLVKLEDGLRKTIEIMRVEKRRISTFN